MYNDIFHQIIDFIRSLYSGKDIIPLHEPCFYGNEKVYVLDCIESNVVSSIGKYVDKFEELVKNYSGVRYAVATANGTAALHTALLLAGVNVGDFVITQPLTFVATSNAIAYCGAEPVYIDIDEKTLGLSPVVLEKWLKENCDVISIDNPQAFENHYTANIIDLQNEKICIHKDTKRRISACIPMHTFGHPCEIDKIIEICERYYIKVVEDAAEAIGSYYKNKHMGSFGLIGTISFNGNKTITTGGGGMLLTNNEIIGKLAKHITTQAKIPHPWKYEHDYIGFNYRLPNINAALGCAQMEYLDDIIEKKRKLANTYKEFFSSYSTIGFVSEPPNSKSNYWLNAIVFKDDTIKERFLMETNAEKVTTRPSWVLNYKLKSFKNTLKSDIHVSEQIEKTLVNLPSSVR